jgi:hypothetical protein
MFLWGRRLAIPMVKAVRTPSTRTVLSVIRRTCQPGLPANRQPPGRVQSLRDYVSLRPSDALVIPAESNPHGEIAAQLHQARVVGESGQICLPDCLLGDVSFEWFMEPEQLSLLYRWSLPPVTPLKGLGTSIAVISGHCYYHWLLNSLPRLGILELAGIRLNDLDFIITNPLRHPFQRESLVMLGVDCARIRETGKRITYFSEALALTTIPGFIQGFHHEFLRRRLAPAQPNESSWRRLYLARGDSRHRHVTNEPSIIAALTKEGFEVCHPEELSLREQIRLFQEAQVVVAPHGAALANLVFCAPGTRVAEVFSSHYFNDCYQTLSRETGLKHWCLTHRPGTQLISDHRYVEEPMEIDLDHLMTQLRDIAVL